MTTGPCYGIDYGYVCHLGDTCARVTPDATVEHAMLCEHLEFEHYAPRPDVERRELIRIRDDWRRRGVASAARAIRRAVDGVPAAQPQGELFA